MISIISKRRLSSIQSMLCDLLDSVPVLEAERDSLRQQAHEAERNLELLKRENRMLRDAAATLQVQRDKYMRESASLKEDNKFLSAVLDNVSAARNDEVLEAVIGAVV